MKSMNIRKTLIMGIALSALPFLVSAAEISSPKKDAKQEVRAEVKERQEDIRAEITAKKESFLETKEERILALKKHFGEVRAKKIEEFFNHMVGKFESAITRLDSIALRLQKYLDRLSGEGKDVVSLKIKLDDAKSMIMTAETGLEEAKLKFGAMATGTDPKKDFKDVKSLFGEVAKKVKAAHAGLVDVINSIKGSSDTGTSTPQ